MNHLLSQAVQRSNLDVDTIRQKCSRDDTCSCTQANQGGY